jgi:hypothetical protein
MIDYQFQKMIKSFEEGRIEWNKYNVEYDPYPNAVILLIRTLDTLTEEQITELKLRFL